MRYVYLKGSAFIVACFIRERLKHIKNEPGGECNAMRRMRMELKKTKYYLRVARARRDMEKLWRKR